MDINGVEFVDLSRSPFVLRQVLFFLHGAEVRVEWKGPLEVSGQGILTSAGVDIVAPDEEAESETMLLSLGLEATDFTPGMDTTISIPMDKESFTIYSSDAMSIRLSANSGDLVIDRLSGLETFPNLI